MSASTEQLLYLMAEVSIATVALSGITMFIAVSNMQIDYVRATQIGAQLRMAFCVTLFAILPLFLLRIEFTGEVLWRVASVLYVCSVIYLWIDALRQAKRHAQKLRPPALVKLAGLSALVLLGANIWLARNWPYLLQLLIAWTVSMVIYLAFISDVLHARIEPGGAKRPTEPR